MKTLVSTLLLALLALLLPACSSGGSDEPSAPPTPELTLSTQALTFQAEGGKQSFTASTNATQLSVTTATAWLTVKEVKSGTANARQFEVTAQANTQEAEREGVVDVKAGTLGKSIRITQAKAEPQPPTPEPAKGLPAEMAAKLGMGWNLGNNLDAHSNGVSGETLWGNQPATLATFQRVQSAGFRSVRIPVTWMGHVGAAPDYPIEEAWLNRVAEVVGYAKQCGLNAIINIHHDGADSQYWLNIKEAAQDAAKNEAVKAQLTAMWRQIATRFKDEGEYLLFENVNEIQDGGWGWGANRTDGGKQYQTLNGWHQAFVDAVRSVGGANSHRFLGIASYSTDPELAVSSSLVLPRDAVADRLMLSVHYYAPYEFSQQAKYTEWGHTGAAAKKVSGYDEEYVQKVFAALKQQFIDANIPVYIGELGATHRSASREESFRKYYMEYVCKAAKEYGLIPFYWDNGASTTGQEAYGIIHHATGAWLNNGEEIATLMVRAVEESDASYTLQSVYDGAPK